MKTLLTSILMIATFVFGSVNPGLAAADGPEADVVKRIPADSSRSFTATFDGDEFAEVAVIGDGDTYLSVEIRNEFGRLVTKSEWKTVHYLRWFVYDTQEYTIKIVNHGSVYNDCRILTN